MKFVPVKNTLSYPANAFSTQDEVIAWICANQLGRRNISEETRRYLMVKDIEAEKTLGQKILQAKISMPKAILKTQTLKNPLFQIN